MTINREENENYEFIDKLNKEQKTWFLRGLWDSEGTINIVVNVSAQVRFSQKDVKLCELFSKLLLEITGIPSKISSSNMQTLYNSYFYKREYIIKFYDIIQPTIQRKRKIFEEIKRLYTKK
jgi:hypothetical protein